MYAPTESAEAKRFTRRLVVLEEPRVAARIEELAGEAGHSMSAEIRTAVRWWIRSIENQDER
jgi:hypothetical protein